MVSYDSSHHATGLRGDDVEFIKASKAHFAKQNSVRCICGNLATVTMHYKLRFIVVCKSCKHIIDHDEHDVPTDEIRKLLGI